MGVRAEAKLLRESTPLENLSAAFQDLSTYVASTYHNYQATGRPSHAGSENQICYANASATSRTATFATFDWYEWDEDKNRRLCLLLGYADGFQVWDVEEPQEIREVVSVREDGWDREAGRVVGMKFVPICSDSEGKSPLCDVKGSVLAVVTVKTHRRPTTQQKENTDGSSPNASTDSSISAISLFSLNEHRILRTREFQFDGRTNRRKRHNPGGVVRFIRCNSRCIIVETAHPSSLHVFSIPYLESVGQFLDLAPPIHIPVSSSPNSTSGSTTIQSYITPPGLNWSLGPRLLSYASTVDDGSQKLDDVSMMDGRLAEGGIKVIKEVGEVGWGVVRSLGDFGYQKLSNYFASSPPSTSPLFPAQSNASASVPIPSYGNLTYSRSSPSVGGVGVGPRRTSSSTPGSYSPAASSFSHQPSNSPIPSNDGAINDGSGSDHEAGSTVGTVVIHDTLSLLYKSLRSSDNHFEDQRNCRPVAHFRAHSNAITAISFNPSGTLLATASSGGHTINIYEFTGSQNAFSSFDPGSCPGTSPSPSLGHTHTPSCVHSSMRHVFKLKRGYTSAKIRDLTWSPDSQSLAATTSRGTVHIWGLGLYGSAGNISSFPSAPSSGATPPKSLSSVVRIRLRAAGGSGIGSTSTGYYPSTRNERNMGVDGAGAVIAGFMAEEGRSDCQTEGTMEEIQPNTTAIPYLYSTLGPICHFLSPLSRTRIATDNRTILITTKNTQHDTSKDNETGTTITSSTLSNFRLPFRMPSTHPHLFSSLPLSSFGKSSETVTAYQEMYDWNPSGTLTMHRLKWEVGSAKKESENERRIDRSDLALASVSSEDIAEWNLMRSEDWEETRASAPEGRKRNRTQSGGDHTQTETRWLAHAEIVTHPPLYGHPLWKTIAFQVYSGTNPEKESKTSHDEGSTHGLPPTKPLEIRRYVPKPYSCDENSGNEDSGEGKIVGEKGGALQEHISTAMGTDLEFHPKYQPVDLHATSRTGQSLSFEDAYLIQPKLVEYPATFPLSLETSPYHISQSSFPSSARTSLGNHSPNNSSPWRKSRNKQKKDPPSLATIRSKAKLNSNEESTDATDDAELVDEDTFDDDEILFSHNRDPSGSQIIVLDTDDMVDGVEKEKV